MRTQESATLRLLVVEANANDATSLQFTLTCAGYTVFVVTSEEAAITCITRNHIHLVLIGESFVANHGFTLCAWLRRLFSLPIIIVAPLKHPDDLTTALRLGATDYIVKPIHNTMLLARIANLLRRSRKKLSRRWCKSDLSL